MQAELDKEEERKIREDFVNRQQFPQDPPKLRIPKCTCSRNGMIMSFHKEYCELNLLGGKY